MNPIAGLSPFVGMWLNCIYGGKGVGMLQTPGGAQFIAFSAQTRMSGVDLSDGSTIRKGAADAVIAFVRKKNGVVPEALAAIVMVSRRRARPPLPQ